MSLTRRSTLAEVVLHVAGALASNGIYAVLTGGACASLYSEGEYTSLDLDFVLQNAVTPAGLDAAMSRVGFTRRNNHYGHPKTIFVVEFPAGPLAIGADLRIKPIEYRVRAGRFLTLSPTDACRDRLAAFYHWDDRQSLEVAAAIARHSSVDLKAVRRWSADEGALPKFDEFLRQVERKPAARKRKSR